MNSKLSILIPVYNEWKTIQELLTKLLELRVEKEIIVVDDGSNDGTGEILNSTAHPLIRVFKHPVNRGKGAAIRTGLSHCTGDIIIIQDADLDQDLNLLYQLIRPIVQDGARIVYGSRFLAERPKMKWTNYLANHFLSFLTRFLYRAKVTDVETCFKAFAADVIKSIPLETDGFEFEVEITAKVLKQSLEIREVPIRQEWYQENHHKITKLTWVDGVKAIATLMRYRFKE